MIHDQSPKSTAAPLTEEELAMIAKSATEEAFKSNETLIKSFRQGKHPSDWAEKVHASGLYDRLQKGWLMMRGKPAPDAPQYEFRPINGNLLLRMSDQADRLGQTVNGVLVADDNMKNSKGNLIEFLVIAVAADVPKETGIEEGRIVLVHKTRPNRYRTSMSEIIYITDWQSVHVVLHPVEPAFAAPKTVAEARAAQEMAAAESPQ